MSRLPLDEQKLRVALADRVFGQLQRGTDEPWTLSEEGLADLGRMLKELGPSAELISTIVSLASLATLLARKGCPTLARRVLRQIVPLKTAIAQARANGSRLPDRLERTLERIEVGDASAHLSSQALAEDLWGDPEQGE